MNEPATATRVCCACGRTCRRDRTLPVGWRPHVVDGARVYTCSEACRDTEPVRWASRLPRRAKFDDIEEPCPKCLPGIFCRQHWEQHHHEFMPGDDEP